MNPESLTNLAAPAKPLSPTTGITTKVVKGTIWTLAGQVLPMLVAFVTTPFVIRLLGSEKYGVLILVGLIPTYFSFANFGMDSASTVFTSEAYGRGLRKREGEVTRTAAVIALCVSLLFAVPQVAFSDLIVREFVPEHLTAVASIALKFTAISFVVSILATIFNSPILARLRMELNTLVNAVPRILLAVFTVAVIFLGGDIIGAVVVGFAIALVGLLATIYFSARLLPELLEFSINPELFRPLLKFGGGIFIGSIAGILLMNFEKLALSKLISVEALAYYSVAFTFAGMATMFSSAMMHSMGPAFAQLNVPEKEEEFNALFARGMRLNLIWLPPSLLVLFVIARPFFTLWAGEDFGRESTLPFYILLFGLFFNVLAYIPLSTISAKGRTDVFAKLYWIELFIYVISAIVLINQFGILGAAAAYSLRVTLDALILISVSKRVAGVKFRAFNYRFGLSLGAAALLPPILLTIYYDNFSWWLLAAVPLSVASYSLIMWKTTVETEEKAWAVAKAKHLLRQFNNDQSRNEKTSQ